MTDRTQEHETLVADLLVALTALDCAMFYKNSSGVGRTKRGALIRAGVKGGGDIMGCYRGRAVAVEAKTGDAAQRQSQRRFERAWTAAGGLYVVARSVAGAIAVLERECP